MAAILTRRGTGADIRKEKPECGESAKVRHRTRCETHRQTGGGIEHPYRDIKKATALLTRLAASKNRAVRFLQNVVNADRLADLGMPCIRNRLLVGCLGNMGVLSFGCSLSRPGGIRKSLIGTVRKCRI